jgi:gliding motility-associated-like protein
MKKFTFSLLFSLLSLFSFSQSCPNIGFEDSNFVGWEGLNGRYVDSVYRDSVAALPPPAPFQWGGTNPVYHISNGFTPTGHVIMSGVEYDPYTDSTVLTVAPGSDFSVRLGNDGTGARTEWLTYTTTIDSNNLLFVYAVAIVLEDPLNNHTIDQRPGFFVRVLDSAGNELDTVCGKIGYIPGTAGVDDFLNWSQDTNFKYRPWDFAGLDLLPFIGQEVTIEFASRDCSRTGHFGYAYIDGNCFPRQIDVDYCLGQSDSITFTAPLGFGYLWSSGDTTQTIKILADSADTLYTCTLTSTLTGCSFTLDARPDPTFYSNFSITETSCGEAIIFPTLDINRGSIASYFWNFGDTTTTNDTSTAIQPSYTYPGPGKYEVILIADDGLGCFSDTLRDSVNIYFPPQAMFTHDTVCFGDTTFFSNLSDVSYNVVSSYLWDFGDSSTIDTNFSPTYVYEDDTAFNVTLIVWSDSIQCGDTLTQQVLVHPRPDVDFYKIEPDSCIPHEVHFVNTSTFSDSSAILTYIWNFGNDTLSNALNPVYIYNQPGIYSPHLIAIDTFGCSDSIQVIDLIRVAEIPEAIFSADSVEVHISNAVIGFSNMSAAADAYLWTFGDSTNNGVGSSEETDPIWTFNNAGYYNVQLLAYSFYGCFDTATLNIHVVDDRMKLQNVITPNGDGLNDVFYFNGEKSSLSNFNCAIFNRWGTMIYETRNPSFHWDGTTNGEFVTPGTYFYTLEYTGYKGRLFQYRGEITLIR